ncbi:LOW QUALITY PROTEIN: PGC-1 and ERR-induced regulator in muscle protein 1 [Melanerpes formicivorus]|uniref:LOW QUALITY PROTEIN: PGC-1 and ERR-induced regulator in muscle protein 1 n=1 Tax=Melanerpes formicivorus TaxID=211600 RepID=UPI00358EC91F
MNLSFVPLPRPLISPRFAAAGMDDFEYSIQLNDRDWAEFFLESEECDLAPAALATAEEQCLSDIEQGDSVSGSGCPASTEAARVGSRPELGTGSSSPRGVPGDAPPRWLAAGHLSLPELLSGSEDEAELGSVGRFLCDSDKPGRPSPTRMPSVQGRQPPCPPAATPANPAGGTAEGSPGQDAACEAAAPQPAPEKAAARSGQAMEHPSQPAGTSSPEKGRDTGAAQPHGKAVAQPGAPVQDSLPTLAASPKAARKSLGSSASRSDPGVQGPLRDPPPGPALGTVPKAPGSPAREEASRERTGTEPSSPDVVRPKVPGTPKKSRKQRGASATEAAQGDREPAGAVAQGTGAAVKTPLSSPLSSRKGKGKEKAARPALVKLGSEEAADSKQPAPGPGTDEGDPAMSTLLKQKVKEPGTQPQGKAKATKQPKPGQPGGLGLRDNVPEIPASQALGEACREASQEPPHPKSVEASRGDSAPQEPPHPKSVMASGGVAAPQEPPHPKSVVAPGGVAAPQEPPHLKRLVASGGGTEPQEPPHLKRLVASGGVAAPQEPPHLKRLVASGGGAEPQEPPHPKSVMASGGVAAPQEVPCLKRLVGSGGSAEPQEPPHPKIVVSSAGGATGGACGEPAAESPKELGPPCFAAGAPARAASLDVTWPEMYDYMFCDSQEEEDMWDSMEGERTPLEREISLPELYEYFFNEPEGNRKKAKGKDRKRKKFSSLDHTRLRNEDPSSAPVRDSLVVSVPEVYEHFFRDGPGSRVGWRRIFSVTPASEVKKAVGALKSLLQRHLVGGQAPAPQALLRRGSGEKLSLVPLAPPGRGQTEPEGLGMALALRGGPETPLALTHKDMCLVFCAFASWAVKTSDLQAPDAWKTMFLASFGTLSAIRYFRRQVREGHPRI